LIYIRLKRKTVVIVALTLFVLVSNIFVLLGLRGFFVMTGAKESASVIDNEDYQNSNLTAYLNTSARNDDETQYVEIFDIEKGRVIKRVKVSFVLQTEAIKYLDSITGVYVKASAFPKSGYIIRIPFEVRVEIHNKWFDGLLKEVFVIFTGDEEPYLLMLDDKNRPLFYKFSGDTRALLKGLNFSELY